MERSTEILFGLNDISTFLGVERKRASALVKAGLPVCRLGLGLASTRKLVLDWLENRCKEGR